METVTRIMLNLGVTSGRTGTLTVWVLLPVARYELPFPSVLPCLSNFDDLKKKSPHIFIASLIFAWHTVAILIKIVFITKMIRALPQPHPPGQKSRGKLSTSPQPPRPVLDSCLFSVLGKEPRTLCIPSKHGGMLYARSSFYFLTLRQRSH